MKKKEPKTRIKKFLDLSKKYQDALESFLILQDVQISVLMQNDTDMQETQKRQQQQIDDMAKDYEVRINKLMENIRCIIEDIALHGEWIDKLGEQVY